MKYFLTLLIVLGLFTNLFSQEKEEETWHCLTDQIYWKLVDENPNLLYQRQYLNEFVKEYIKNNPHMRQESSNSIYPIILTIFPFFIVCHSYLSLSYRVAHNGIISINSSISTFKTNS
jgi:hypothetical protein